MRQPSRALLIAAGALTQLLGAICFVLAMASLPVVHDLHGGLSSVIASIVASLAALVCGTFVWRGRLTPLALAAGLDVGFGIGLPQGNSAIGAMLRMVAADDAEIAETLVASAAIGMFAAAILCVLAVPSALKLRHWAREAQLQPTTEITDLQASRPTLRGFGPKKLIPTQVIRLGAPARGKPAVIVGVAITMIALGIIVLTAATGGDSSDSSMTSEATKLVGSSARVTAIETTGSAATVPTIPAVDAKGDAPPVEDLVERFHTALAKATPADLGRLLDSKVFAFGADAHDLGEGRDAVVAQLRDDLGEAPTRGFEVSVRYIQIGREPDVAWIAEELRVGSKTFVVTAVAGLRDHEWTIHALHWALPMPNDTAYRLARAGELSVPDAIPDAHDPSPLATAMRTAFASKPSFVDARSERTDAFNFGSALGERLKGGASVKKVFSRLRATIRLHDAVHVGSIGERGGWGFANLDFTGNDKDGTEVTQTFRVLVAWVKEDAGWRIVQTHFSNAR